MILRHDDNLRGADNSSPRSPSPSAHGGAVEPECRYLRVGQQGQRGCGARGARGGRRSAHESSRPRGTADLVDRADVPTVTKFEPFYDTRRTVCVRMIVCAIAAVRCMFICDQFGLLVTDLQRPPRRRGVACHDVRSHADAVALVIECSVPVV